MFSHSISKHNLSYQIAQGIDDVGEVVEKLPLASQLQGQLKRDLHQSTLWQKEMTKLSIHVGSKVNETHFKGKLTS